MTIRYPAPLVPGDRIGVTAPSSGVPARLRGRLEVALRELRDRGYDVLVGECLDGAGVVSASAPERAAELQAMLLDPEVRAVVPPWGGELAVELLPHLDLAAVAAAEPTWLVGYSDISTLLLPLSVVSGVATLHGQNLMETPYRVPEPLRSWLEVVGTPPGGTVVQGASRAHRGPGHDDWEGEPGVREMTLDQPSGWRLLDPAAGPLQVSGRLIGGCLETVSILSGSPYGDVPGFAAQHAPEGLVVYLEASEDGALDVARHLWRLRLSGWFEPAHAVLIGRTAAPDAPGFTQVDAVRSVLGDLDLPVVLDVDCGHVAPYLALVNGALAEVTVEEERQEIVQRLV